MILDAVTEDFRRKIDESIQLEPQGLGRYRVLTPFQFDDGDHLVIVLRQMGDRWVLSDEGHTFMQLTYHMEEASFRTGTRHEIIEQALSAFGVTDSDGELVIDVPEGRYGDALYSFIQAVLKISDVTFLTRERARSTFFEDLQSLVGGVVPQHRRVADWHEPTEDPHGKYKVNWRINEQSRPIFLYGLNSDEAVRDANIALLQFEKWRLNFHSVAIFEDQEQVGRGVLSRFTDVCERQFSSLDARERIESYLRDQLVTS